MGEVDKPAPDADQLLSFGLAMAVLVLRPFVSSSVS
jgi:hypothetical protein